jgi:hypothetical protein
MEDFADYIMLTERQREEASELLKHAKENVDVSDQHKLLEVDALAESIVRELLLEGPDRVDLRQFVSKDPYNGGEWDAYRDLNNGRWQHKEPTFYRTLI